MSQPNTFDVVNQKIQEYRAPARPNKKDALAPHAGDGDLGRAFGRVADAAATRVAPPVVSGAPKRALPSDSAARKEYPMCAGLLDYFPDACAEVAHISYLGNQKHNPGEPLHWARGKSISMDHADCILRHLTERGTHDSEGLRHAAQLAWRALALLQEELEAEKGFSCPRGATELPVR